MDWSLLGFQGLGQLLNLHPVFVHFPIALFPTAFLFYGLGLLRKRHDFLLAGQICLALGLTGAAVSVLTGYWAEETFSHGETIHYLMETHETIGFVILGLGTLLTLWSFMRSGAAPKASKIFMGFLGLTVLLILQNADLGGRMVFVEGAAVKAVPAPAEPGSSTEGGLVPETGKDSHDHHGHEGQHHHH